MRFWLLILAVLTLSVPADAHGYKMLGRSMRGAFGGYADGTCPYSGTSSVDGCASASATATVQHTNFFTSYATQSGQTYTSSHPPQWNVAGVEYPVGSSSTAGLTDVSSGVNASLTGQGCYWGGTSGGHAYQWYCSTGSGTLNISNLYFNGVGLYILGGTYTAVNISNSYFKCSSNMVYSAMVRIGALSSLSTGSVTVANSTFDGQSFAGGSCANQGTLTVAVEDDRTGGGGNYSVTHSAFLNSPTRALSMNGANTSIIKYNYFENVSGYSGLHGESIIQYGDRVTTIRDIEYNTFFQSSNPWIDFVLGTGSVSFGVLNLTSVTATGGNGIVTVNEPVYGAGIPAGTTMSSFGTATGSGAGLIGTYNLSNGSITVGSETIQFAGPGDITAHSFGQGNYATNYATSYVFSNNVLISNRYNNRPTQGGLYYASGYFFGSYAIQNNYMDPTGAALCYYGRTGSTINSVSSTNGSPTITVADSSGVANGLIMYSSNMGFAANSTVVSTTGTTITMSSNATTTTAAGVINFDASPLITFAGNTNLLNGEGENSISPTCTGHG